MTAAERLVGPRVPARELRAHPVRYALPTLMLGLAALMLLGSIFLPYWKLTLHAPQYPQGLSVQVSLTGVAGDVAELDGLNHYIGMRPLGEAAKFEREMALYGMGALALLLLSAIFIHTRWAAALALPVILFPAIFLGDLHYWMRDFGLNLDPHAPLSSAVKPFVPPVLGWGYIAQFKTYAEPQAGLWLAGAASLVVVAGLALHRRAYKPLVDAATRGGLAALALLLLAPPAAADTLTVPPGGSLQAVLATARDGDTVVVQGGVHRGPLEVRRSVTLEGRGHPVIDGGGRGTVVRLAAPGSVLRGFTVRGSGSSLDQDNAGVTVEAPRCTVDGNVLEDTLFGVYLRHADGASVTRNRILSQDLPVARRGDPIRVWYSNGVRLADNRVERGRDVVLWYSERLEVTGNQVSGSRYGLHFMYCDDATVQGNLLTGNSVGAFLMYSRRLRLRGNTIAGNRGPSGYGVGLKDMDDAHVVGNLIADNRVGAFLDNSPREVDSTVEFRDNVFAFNDQGMSLLPSVQRNHVTGNSFVENREQVNVAGGGLLKGNTWSEDGRGNHWSDYAGYDADRDGVGDLPYRSERLFEDVMERHPHLRLFLDSPVARAVDLAARAFPLVRPEPKLEDALPRLAPTVPEGLPRPPEVSRAGLPAVSGGVLLLALALLAVRPAPSRPAAVKALRPQPVPEGSMISVARLSRRFGATLAVEDLTFEVARGEAVALWGPNGAGKTTALRCVLGVIPCEGTLALAGHDLRREPKEARRLAGFVPQELNFHDDLTVGETMDFYARLRRLAAPPVARLLERVGLQDQERKRVGQLSGGMKQRLALALALLDDPPLLILDEPTASLDARAREEFLELLLRQKSEGKTLLFTSHRPEEILLLADRVLVLEDGRLVASGPPASVASRMGWEFREGRWTPTVPRRSA